MQEKLKVFDRLMEEDHILLHLDSRREGVLLPPNLMNNHRVTLQLSYHFQGETKRDQEGISSYLKFQGVYHQCFLPWKAVWGITSASQEQIIWPEDLPAEMLLELGKAKLTQLKEKFFGKSSPEAASEKQLTDPVSATTEKKPKVFLRRIK